MIHVQYKNTRKFRKEEKETPFTLKKFFSVSQLSSGLVKSKMPILKYKTSHDSFRLLLERHLSSLPHWHHMFQPQRIVFLQTFHAPLQVPTLAHVILIACHCWSLPPSFGQLYSSIRFRLRHHLFQKAFPDPRDWVYLLGV